MEYGETRTSRTEEDRLSGLSEEDPGFTSSMEDTIILYATVPGMVSYR